MIEPKGLDHVAVNCRDLERSLKFYTEILGLRVSAREHQKPGIEIFLDCGPSLVGLIQGKDAGEAHPFADQGFGANHFSIRVDTQAFDAAVERLQGAGVRVLFAKKRERSWSVYFTDPDGNKLELTAWPLEDRA